jgi:hypothetical protein
MRVQQQWGLHAAVEHIKLSNSAAGASGYSVVDDISVTAVPSPLANNGATTPNQPVPYPALPQAAFFQPASHFQSSVPATKRHPPVYDSDSSDGSESEQDDERDADSVESGRKRTAAVHVRILIMLGATNLA